jgi:hypothetical protein
MAAAKKGGEQGGDKAGEQGLGPTAPVPDSAAGAMQEILDQTVIDALNKVRPDQLIGPRHDEELVKGNTHDPSAWIYSLANVQLLTQAEQRLTRIANLNRPADAAQVGQVNRVDARLVPGTKLLILRPASDNDLTAAPIKRYRKNTGAWINLFDLLAPDKLTVDKGYQERYAVNYVPETSPLWPALVMNLDKPLERKGKTKLRKPRTARKPQAQDQTDKPAE